MVDFHAPAGKACGQDAMRSLRLMRVAKFGRCDSTELGASCGNVKLLGQATVGMQPSRRSEKEKE